MTKGDYVYYQQKILNISTFGELRIFMLEVLQEIYECLEKGSNSGNDGDISGNPNASSCVEQLQPRQANNRA